MPTGRGCTPALCPARAWGTGHGSHPARSSGRHPSAGPPLHACPLPRAAGGADAVILCMVLPQKRSLGGGGLCPLLKPPPHMESSSWSLGGLCPLKKTPYPRSGARTPAGQPPLHAGPLPLAGSGARTPPGRPAPTARLPSAQAGWGRGHRSLPGSGARMVPSRLPPAARRPLPRAGWERGPRSPPGSGALMLSFCTWSYLRRDL